MRPKLLPGLRYLMTLLAFPALLRAETPPTPAALEKTCAQGKAQDCFTLGLSYESKGDAQDVSRAAGLYRQACDTGFPKACLKYGLMADAGSGVPKDQKEGASFYDKACRGGDASGCLNLGIDQVYGVGVPQNLEGGATLIEQSCLKASLPIGCRIGGNLVASALGQAPLEDKALEFYKRGCELKDTYSCYEQEVFQKTPPSIEAWRKPNPDYAGIAKILTAYSQLVPLGPRSKTAYDALEDTAMRARRFSVLRSVAERRAKAGPGYSSPGLLAYAYYNLSKFTEAAAALDADQKSFPDDARVYYVRSRIEFHNRNWPAAQIAAEQAINRFEHQGGASGTGLARYGLPWSHYQRAWSLLHRAELKEAEKEAARWEALPSHNKSDLEKFRERLHEVKASLLYVGHYFQEPVTLGTYHLLGDKDAPAGAFAHLTLQNLDKRDRTFQVELGLPDVTQRLSQSVTVLKESMKDVYLTPPLKLDFNAKLVREERQVPIEMKIVEKLPGGDKVILEQTRPIVLKPREFLPLARNTADGLEPKTEFLGAWITPNSEVVEQFLSAAKHRTQDRTFAGGQKPSLPQVKALWQEMQSRGISYVMDPDTMSDANAYQRLRLPSEVLSSTNAQCLEGAIAFATLLEAIQIKPFLVLGPGHAFVGWDLAAGETALLPGLHAEFLETTMVSSASFEEAVKKAEAEAIEWSRAKKLTIVRVDQLRQKRFFAQPAS